ncbi:DUF7009 family protein [Dyadobacter sp. CY326]|uniref:DUF7009 family protein n=1 Tax=Dyadobacter sp. CY326 TaxID=2907300 RepID=UPI001F25BCBD|nr:hypothetical protein [Dyadobacter sp. CY326]MCE7064332.1 hypothetical protein [Dyadobacter sp. CY326]
MKIRIQRNSVRFRLSKTDIAQLSKTGFLKEETIFMNARFGYAISRSTTDNELSATFEDGTIVLIMPEHLINGWAENDVVGFKANMQVNDAEPLHLLVEKDFKCLDNVAEDQSDNYENPKTC